MLAGRAGLSPVMVGRKAELGRLRALLNQVADEPAVALVEGEAGIGKSRLVRELVTALPEGTVVLAGQAVEGAMGGPFQVLHEALEPLVSGWDEVPEPLRPYADVLCLLLGSVAPRLTHCPDREYGREELLRAAVELVRYLAGRGPALVVFDDLHWADAESVALVGRLALSPGLPVLLVGLFRPEDVDRRHPLTELLANLDRQRVVVRLSLCRLDRPRVGELVSAVYGRPVPAITADALHRRTGGNPFFLEELLATAGDAQPEDLAHLPLPWNLAEAVHRRLDGLRPDDRRVLDAASVLGQRITFDLLAAVTGCGEDELIDILRRLVEGGVLIEGEPDVFTFRHALTRDAVADQLLGREHRRLHEKAFVALQELGSDDHFALAHHAAGAGRYDEMVEAARRGARAYLRSGSTLHALRLAKLGLEEDEHDLDLLEVAARAAWYSGHLRGAIRAATRWADEAASANRPELASAAYRLLSRLHWEAGDRASHRHDVERAAALAEPLGASEPLALALALKADAYMLSDDPDLAQEWADRALAMAADVGSARARPPALLAKGSMLASMPTRRHEGIALLKQAASEAEAVGDELSQLRAIYNLAASVAAIWPPERNWALLDRAREVAARLGREAWSVGVLPLREATLHELDGDLAAARGALATALDPSSERSEVHQLFAAEVEARYALEAGEIERGASLLAELSTGTASTLRPRVDTHLVAARAALAARSGDIAAASRALVAYLDERPHFEGWLLDEALRILLDMLHVGMPPAQGRELLARLLERGTAEIDDQALLDQVEGALLEAAGDTAGAEAAFRRALADRGQRRAAWVAADVHARLARVLLSQDREADALTHAREAARLLERWPGWRQDEVAGLLRRFGEGPAVEGPVTLTPREREVAALVAEGLSNAEVARRLFISAKTASVHVSNILSKLGMSSRAEIAAWAVRNGLPEPGKAT